MIRIHFTAADFARVRFAARPVPLQELHAALGMMSRRDGGPLFDRWRQRLLRELPAAALSLADLVPGGRAPLFLDNVLGETLTEAAEALRSERPGFVRMELERVYAGRPAPTWLRGLHRGEPEAWQRVLRGQRAAFEAALAPVWSRVQDLHRAEFTRYAVTVAERGAGPVLQGLVPGSQLADGLWEFPSPTDREVALGGRGLVLLPTFHWTCTPLVADRPGHTPVLTYPAGPGLPLPRGDGAPGDGLAAVLGRTRRELLVLLDREHTTTGLARRLRISNATASQHAAALRAAGLIATERAGRAVLHRRTPLGDLLLRGT